MLFDTETVPTRKELLIDLATFAGTVVVAVVQGWKAADIVWASWIASLLIGLSFFLVLAIKMLLDYTRAVSPVKQDEGLLSAHQSTAAAGDAEDESEEDSRKELAPMDSNPGCLCLAIGSLLALLAWLVGPGPIRMALFVLVVLDVFALVISILAPRGWLGVNLQRPTVRAFYFLPTAMFLFFFFLVHFGGFHAGHALFLSFVVPVEVEFTANADSLVGLRETLVAFLGVLIFTYWPYIVSVAVKNFGAYRAALFDKSKGGDAMILPYKNVIRIHILIFALVPLAAFGSSLVLTVAVLAFFFFPVESVVAWYRSRS